MREHLVIVRSRNLTQLKSVRDAFESKTWYPTSGQASCPFAKAHRFYPAHIVESGLLSANHRGSTSLLYKWQKFTLLTDVWLVMCVDGAASKIYINIKILSPIISNFLEFFNLEDGSIRFLRNVGLPISLFHRAFFSSIIDKTPTHALFYSTLY